MADRGHGTGSTSADFALHCRGDVRLFRGDRDCTPKSKKGRALLAILAAEQRPLSRVRIIDLLWSDRQEEQARASLRTLLADFKEQFGEAFDALLAVDRERVALAAGVRTDLTDPTLAPPAGELFEGLDHIDPELDEWLRVERQKWAATGTRPAPAAALQSRPLSNRRLALIVFALLFLGAVVTTAFFTIRFGYSRLQQTSADSSARVKLARRLLDQENAGDALRARELLLAEVQEQPADATTLGYLAEATMSASDHTAFAGTIPLEDARREARAYGRQAVALDPKNAAAWAALGWSRFVTAESVAPFERAVALEPANPRYRTQLGRALEYQNRYDEAYLHQQKAMSLDPQSLTAVLGFLRAASPLDRPAEMKRAVAAFERRSSSPRKIADAKGYLAYQLGDEPGCIKHLQPIVTKGYRRPLSALLSCLSALGEIERAARLDSTPSLRSDVLRRDIAALERRALSMGKDIWLRNFESLAAADLLVKAGKAETLVASFDANYTDVADFLQQGGRMAMEPYSLLLAMKQVGRNKEAQQLRAALARQSTGQKDGMKFDTWALYLKAAVALVDERPDQAVKFLGQCFPDCFIGFYQIDISETAFFSRLNNHPGFRLLVSRYRQQLNTRRKQAGLAPLPTGPLPAAADLK